MSDTLARAAFAFALLFLVVFTSATAGFAVASLELWPYAIVKQVADAGRSFAKFGAFLPENSRHEAPAGASEEAFVRHAGSLTADGHFYLAARDSTEGRERVRFRDGEGAVAHETPIDYAALDPEADPTQTYAMHGVAVLPDGDVLVNFDHGRRMARIDPCGTPVWVRDGVFHHSIALTERGTAWTWRSVGDAYSQEQFIEEIDAGTGETLASIPLTDLIDAAGPMAALYGVAPGFEPDPWSETHTPRDIFHPNDVEELPGAIADRFPAFSVGDLLVSIREPNLVAVVDRETLRPLWWAHGPWLAQHDPDFGADGRISVFDNAFGMPRSRIVAIDPDEGTVSLLSHAEASAWRSDRRGKHQRLAGGNLLVVIPEEGRMLELSPEGEIVVEVNNLAPGASGFHDDVQNGGWLAPGYLEAMPSCAAPD